MVAALFTILLTIVFLVASFIVNILVMIYGWGLAPVSWLVIIGGGLFSIVIVVVMGSVQGIISALNKE